MPIKTVLVADDSLSRHRRFRQIFVGAGVQKLQHAFTPQEAISAIGAALLREEPFDMICLDHDFGTFDDGRTIANWMVENCLRDVQVLVHSQNPVGAAAMGQILTNARFNRVRLLPYLAL